MNAGVRTLLLACMCALLGIAVWMGFVPALAPVPSAAGPPRIEPLHPQHVAQDFLPETFELSPLGAYAQVSARPLFSESRRPPGLESETAVVHAAPALAPLPALVLTGVVLAPGGRSAMLFDTSRREAVKLAEGASFGGWEVEEVQADGVILRQGRSSMRISLRDYSREAQAPLMRTRAGRRLVRHVATPQLMVTDSEVEEANRQQHEARQDENESGDHR